MLPTIHKRIQTVIICGHTSPFLRLILYFLCSPSHSLTHSPLVALSTHHLVTTLHLRRSHFHILLIYALRPPPLPFPSHVFMILEILSGRMQSKLPQQVRVLQICLCKKPPKALILQLADY